MEKKSIIVFTNTLIAGGAEKQALLLALELNNCYEVRLVVFHGDKVERKYLDAVDKGKLDAIFLRGNILSRLRQFYLLLKRHQVDIIFSYLLTTNLVGALLGRLAGVRIRVGGIRNARLDRKKIALQRLVNNHLNSYTIYNNYRGMRELKTLGFDTSRSLVIPNCFELHTSLLNRGLIAEPRILTVGRFVAQKGYFQALAAMQRLKAMGLRFCYVIVGLGKLEQEIRREINRLDLQKEVELVINPAGIDEYYRSADIYLCSSRFEGLSNTVMEALSFSLPVVATNVGDNDQLVIEGRNGFLVSDSKAELFVEPLAQLLSSAELRNRMGAQSYEIIRDNYNSGIFLEAYKDFIVRASKEAGLTF